VGEAVMIDDPRVLTMTPRYELIIPSASRPHLLGPALDSLIEHCDVPPQVLHVHDDAAFPHKRDAVLDVVRRAAETWNIAYSFEYDPEPISHGPSLQRLLDRVLTSFVLYTQDDLRVLRPLPIARALQVMQRNGLHQIRFNKRATMEYKGTWRKVERVFRALDCPHGIGLCTGSCDVTLTVADHWYFQTGLWRVERIKPVVDFWMSFSGPQSFRERCEVKINNAMNREVPEFVEWADTHFYALPESTSVAMQQDVRAQIQRTFIWGPIGEEQFIENLATSPDDWALDRPRGGTGPARCDSQARG
jgi:hypothetical protein